MKYNIVKPTGMRYEGWDIMGWDTIVARNGRNWPRLIRNSNERRAIQTKGYYVRL